MDGIRECPQDPSNVERAWKLVPLDDDTRDHADTILPLSMVFAGSEALEKCNEELQDYAAGINPDWDGGMIAVAIYRAMVAAAPSSSGEDPLRAALEKVAGALNAVVQGRAVRGGDKIIFTGSWSHLGQATYSQILDEADAALSGQSVLENGPADLADANSNQAPTP